MTPSTILKSKEYEYMQCKLSYKCVNIHVYASIEVTGNKGITFWEFLIT
jgi:hypothetical protein